MTDKLKFGSEMIFLNKDILLSNIDKIHTTEMGIDRIKKNLKLDTKDVVEFCKNKILDKNCNINKQGKNLYCEIDKYGKMLLVDKVLYLTEYLSDGLTAKYHTLLQKNPNGTAYTYYQQLCMSHGGKQKLKYAVLTQIYKSLSKDKKQVCFNKRKGWLLMGWLPAMLYKKRFLAKFKDGEK